MALGRPVEVETLEQRIAARLNEALDQQYEGGFLTGRHEPGLIDLGRETTDGPEVRLTIEDVARIAAQEARAGS